jgi:light-regulated signal transduction histidine kinase (bacteriophytochrome)
MTSLNLSRYPELSAEGLAALGARNVCDREFIHLSGAVQPHGFLLVVDPVSLVVVASANVPHLLGCNADQTAGTPPAIPAQNSRNADAST